MRWPRPELGCCAIQKVFSCLKKACCKPVCIRRLSRSRVKYSETLVTELQRSVSIRQVVLVAFALRTFGVWQYTQTGARVTWTCRQHVKHRVSSDIFATENCPPGCHFRWSAIFGRTRSKTPCVCCLPQVYCRTSKDAAKTCTVGTAITTVRPLCKCCCKVPVGDPNYQC